MIDVKDLFNKNFINKEVYIREQSTGRLSFQIDLFIDEI